MTQPIPNPKIEPNIEPIEPKFEPNNNGFSGSLLDGIDFEAMTPSEFENYLPEFFASGNGSVSTDPRLQKFLAGNPDCAALVRDLETIAEHARSLFEPVEDPSDTVWSKIQSKLELEPDPIPED